jgi:hypothetical protein
MRCIGRGAPVGGSAVGYGREFLAGGRIGDRKTLAVLAVAPLTTDEVL